MPRRDDKGYSWPVSKQTHQSDKLGKVASAHLLFFFFLIPSYKGLKNLSLYQRERVSTTHDHDRSLEKHTGHENHDHNGRIEKDQRKKEREMKEEREQEDNESEDEQDSIGMQHPSNKRKSARRADELIRRQTQFGERGEASGRFVDEKKVPKRMRYQEILVDSLSHMKWLI